MFDDKVKEVHWNVCLRLNLPGCSKERAEAPGTPSTLTTTHMHLHTETHTCAYTHSHSHMCIHSYAHSHICIHSYAHTHTQQLDLQVGSDSPDNWPSLCLVTSQNRWSHTEACSSVLHIVGTQRMCQKHGWKVNVGTEAGVEWTHHSVVARA